MNPVKIVIRHEPMERWEEGDEGLRNLIRDVLFFVKCSLSSGQSTVNFITPPDKTGTTSPPLMKDPIQRHNYLEIGIVADGTMGMWWQGRLDVCNAGTVLIIPPYCPHLPHVPLSFHHYPSHRVLWLLFPNCQCIAHQCAFRDKIHYFGTYWFFNDEKLFHLGQMIWQESLRRGEWSLDILGGLLLSLLGVMLKVPSHPPIPSYRQLRTVLEGVEDPLVRSVYRFLWQNYYRTLKLSDLATAFNYSPFHLCRRFRQKIGETPLQSLRRIRIEIAKYLLRNFNFPISRVSEMVGFSDQFYFSRLFTRFVGMSPKRYRERNSKGGS